MSNPKHTPGPWIVQTSCSYRRIGNNMGDGNVLYACKQPDGHPDLNFPNGGFDGPDARLIAAAPDLLEALMLMVEQFTKTPSTLKDSEARCKAHAAIAKATGEPTSAEDDK